MLATTVDMPYRPPSHGFWPSPTAEVPAIAYVRAGGLKLERNTSWAPSSRHPSTWPLKQKLKILGQQKPKGEVTSLSNGRCKLSLASGTHMSISFGSFQIKGICGSTIGLPLARNPKFGNPLSMVFLGDVTVQEILGGQENQLVMNRQRQPAVHTEPLGLAYARIYGRSVTLDSGACFSAAPSP